MYFEKLNSGENKKIAKITFFKIQFKIYNKKIR